MRRVEAIAKVAKKTGMPAYKVKYVIDTLMKVYREALEDGDEVRLPRIGVIFTQYYPYGRYKGMRRLRFKRSEVMVEKLLQKSCEELEGISLSD